MTNPLKQIVLILSSQFMKDHPRAGEPTYFREKILSALNRDEELVATCFQKPPQKLHTMRSDYDEWERKIAEVNRGEAVLRVVTWKGIPYRSPWVEAAILTKDDGIDVQKIELNPKNLVVYPAIVTREDGYKVQIDIPYIAKNDGLSVDDMAAWFSGYDLSKPLALIHFTKFRY